MTDTPSRLERLKAIMREGKSLPLEADTDAAYLQVLELRRIADTLESIERILLQRVS